MQTLTEILLEHRSHGVFTDAEVSILAGGSPQRTYSLMKRAIAAGEILHIRRGLYCLASRYLRHPLSLSALAQRIHGPSYVSLESALAWHGWIPEAVYSVFSVCQGRTRAFETALGMFRFVRVPQRTLLHQVQRVTEPDGSAAFVARPIKALADYVFVHRKDWTGAEPLVLDLRIEPEQLGEIRADEVDDLLTNYRSRRVRQFLAGLAREVSACP